MLVICSTLTLIAQTNGLSVNVGVTFALQAHAAHSIMNIHQYLYTREDGTRSCFLYTTYTTYGSLEMNIPTLLLVK